MLARRWSYSEKNYIYFKNKKKKKKSSPSSKTAGVRAQGELCFDTANQINLPYMEDHKSQTHWMHFK